MNNKITAIVLNYNNYIDTIKCVENMVNFGIDVDIVVVDNDSKNDSFRIISTEFSGINNVHIIKNTYNAGYSAGNNLGIKYITNLNNDIKFICIMNPDTTFDYPDLLNRLCFKLSTNERIAVIAPVMIMNGKVDYNATCWNIPSLFELIQKQSVFYRRRRKNIFYPNDLRISLVEAVHGSFFIIKKEILEKINYFDENVFLYNEENILAFNLKKLGYIEAVSLDDFFFHNHGPGIPKKKLKHKLNLVKISSDSRIYLSKLIYGPLLVWVLKSIYLFNTQVIILKHIAGKIRFFLKRGTK